MLRHARVAAWAALPLLVALGIPSRALAQDGDDANPVTVHMGGGAAKFVGRYSDYLSGNYNLDGGIGFALIRQDQAFTGRRWSLYLTGNFIYFPSRISNAQVQIAVTQNPQTPSLLQAVSGREKFFTGTFGPTFRFPQWQIGHFPLGAYASGGFGAQKRTVDFTGNNTVQGIVLQPTAPVISATGGTSGAFDAAFGVNLGRARSLGGLMGFVEIHAVHGLGINSGTVLAPVFGVRW